MLKNRKLTGLWKSVHCNRVYVLTESVITKFYCIILVTGNSADNLCHTRSVAYRYSVELVLLNKHQILGGGACLHCY